MASLTRAQEAERQQAAAKTVALQNVRPALCVGACLSVGVYTRGVVCVSVCIGVVFSSRGFGQPHPRAGGGEAAGSSENSHPPESKSPSVCARGLRKCVRA